MKTPFLIWVILAAMLTHVGTAADLDELSNLEIDAEYRAFLSAMPLEMESGGAKIFKLQDGSIWMVSIGNTIVKPVSSSEMLRRLTVAKAKAQANAVAEINGTEVKATTIMTSSQEIRTVNGVEAGTSQETLDETIVMAAKGVIKEMPVVGRWMNSDESIFFTAIGKRIK